MLFKTSQQTKRLLKNLFAFTALALGVIMVLTPGPGWLANILGLGLLAAEFVRARRLLDYRNEQGVQLRDIVFASPRRDQG
jgi:hypothetical protein